jgi:hypothetical protein
MDVAELHHHEPVASDTREELTPLQLVSHHLWHLAIDDNIDQLEMCTLPIADDVP